MITVSILINGQPIYTRSATREAGSTDEVCTYKCDDGSILVHCYADGAVSLAHQMLDTIKEPSKEERLKKKLDEILKSVNSTKGEE